MSKLRPLTSLLTHNVILEARRQEVIIMISYTMDSVSRSGSYRANPTGALGSPGWWLDCRRCYQTKSCQKRAVMSSPSGPPEFYTSV